jgi:hypothetical protein
VIVRLPRILIALALATSIGLHWGFLQVVAWTGMVISYSQEGSVTEAVVKTFDGDHPCGLCKQIAKGKRTERKAGYKFELGKLKFPHAPVTFIFCTQPLLWEIGASDQTAELVTHAPPVPPPRIL